MEPIRTKHSNHNNEPNARGHLQVIKASRSKTGVRLFRHQLHRDGEIYDRFNDDSGGVFFGEKSYSLHMQQWVAMTGTAPTSLTWEWQDGDEIHIYKLSAENLPYTVIDGELWFIPVPLEELMQQFEEAFNAAKANRPHILKLIGAA